MGKVMILHTKVLQTKDNGHSQHSHNIPTIVTNVPEIRDPIQNYLEAEMLHEVSSHIAYETFDHLCQEPQTIFQDLSHEYLMIIELPGEVE